MRKLKNDSLILKFEDGGFGKNFSDNLKTYNFIYKDIRIQVLKQYDAILAVYVNNFYNKEKKLYINKRYLHYSKTTQTIINKLTKECNLFEKSIKYKFFSNTLEKTCKSWEV